MSLRNRVSSCLAAGLLWAHNPRIAAGRHWGLPFSLWTKFPRPVRKWCSYRLFGPSEEFAQQQIRRHDILGDLIDDNESSWSLSASTILFLWKSLQDRKPIHIVEFGSGLSTLLFARYAKLSAENFVRRTMGSNDSTNLGDVCSSSPVRICSIEHDAEWLETTRKRLKRSGLQSFVKVVHAPLTEQPILEQSRIAYGLPAGLFDDQPAIDFCLIDGPPGAIGRSGCLPLIQHQLAPGALVLLDDAFRDGEQAAWNEWGCRLNGALQHQRMLPTYQRGLAAAYWQPE